MTRTAVFGALFQAVPGAVHRAVAKDGYWIVNGAVNRDVGWAVVEVLYRITVLHEDIPHSAIELYLMAVA